MRHRSLLAPLLHPVLVQPRTRIDAERFRALGVPAERCAHAADLKLLDDVDTGRTALLPPHLEAWFRRHRVLVAASTHPGEESIVLEAWRTVTRRFPDAGLLLAPRHPRRVAVDSVFEVLPRWRAVRDDSLKLGDSAVLVLDTLGDLRGLLGKAFAVLVGGTLVPGVGGHNLFEPALAGKPVLHGPHVENVADQALALEHAGASVRVSSAPSLTTAWKMLLEDEQRVQNHGVAAKTCVTASTLEIAESLDRFVTRFLRSIVHEPTPKEKDGVPGPIPVA